MLFDIVHPKMITLSVGVRNVRTANALHLVQQRLIPQDCLTQTSPVIPSPARDHVINSGESEALMVEMSVEHGCQ